MLLRATVPLFFFISVIVATRQPSKTVSLPHGSLRNDIKGSTGFACAPIPPSPKTNGAIKAPKIIDFPPDIVVGGTVTVNVEISVDDLSSSTREDFYLLSDATGSMRDAIKQTKKEFSKLVNVRRRASKDVAFGVGYYRDGEDNPPFENLQGITKNIKFVKRAINSLEAEGGGDFPEANLYALSQVATRKDIRWRIGSRKILVYFGDAPGHEPICPSAGNIITRSSVIRQLNRKGIAVLATNFGQLNTGLNTRTISFEGDRFGCGLNQQSPAQQATDIANATRGSLRLADDPKELIDVIIDGVENLDQELSVVTTDCDGKVAIKFNPNLPVVIAAGETKTIVEEAEILPGACEFPKGFKCEIDILLSGVGVKQVIQTTSIAGCVPDEGLFR